MRILWASAKNCKSCVAPARCGKGSCRVFLGIVIPKWRSAADPPLPFPVDRAAAAGRRSFAPCDPPPRPDWRPFGLHRRLKNPCPNRHRHHHPGSARAASVPESAHIPFGFSELLPLAGASCRHQTNIAISAVFARSSRSARPLNRCREASTAHMRAKLIAAKATSAWRWSLSIVACSGSLQWEGCPTVFLRGSFVGVALSRSRTSVSAAAMRSLKRSAWRQIFQPCTLALFGLAVAVALCGFSYKLSLYHAHCSAPLRSATAKLWIDPPSDALLVMQRLKSRSHCTASQSALPIFSLRPPQPASVSVSLLSTAPSPAFFLGSPVSLRSPPSWRYHSA